MIIDTSTPTVRMLACLRDNGVQSIIRYYARHTKIPGKRLTRDEAEAIIKEETSLAVVHQSAGDKAEDFDYDTGVQDGAYARRYAANVIGQPENSTIYFGVDYNATPAETQGRIIPYFEGVRKSFGPHDELPEYAIGVYGNGEVCREVLERNLVCFTWLSASRKYHGHEEFMRSGRWTLLQHPSIENWKGCRIDVDENDLNPRGIGFGAFSRLDDLPLDKQEARFVRTNSWWTAVVQRFFSPRTG